jgi:ATP-binding cassette subfamily B protein
MLFAIQQFLDLIQNFSRIDKIHHVVAELTAIPTFLALEGDEPRAGAAAPQLQSDGIRFCQVQFTYPGGQRPAIEGIDLHIRPGERIALVGENGAGKSTLARLLLGLYRPTAGEILVEGADLQSIDPAAWRAQAAAVFQDYMRYTSSARENIGYGHIERLGDDMAIVAAAQQSGASAVVAQLPQGYATLLGKEFEGGVDLSGGQWQTFAIARAYLRDAAVLVLDEPAAALDALAEQEVYRQFLSMSAGKTVLLISHRLGAARLADRILVLQRGRIAEAGTHAELLAAGGHYAQLYRLQAAWYQ